MKLFETAAHIGGQATSIDIDESRHGASWLNDGVQGGSAIFRHTFGFFRRYGYEPQEVKLQVSFGKGRDSFWTNVFPSPLVDELSQEIKKLGRVLKWIKYLLPILGLMPVKILLRMFRFSRDFSNKMVLPLLALFLGTGNQTPNVPSALLERLFDDPNMRLWDYDPDTLLPNLPSMYTFPNLGNFYRDWTSDLQSKGVVFRISCEVEIAERGSTGAVLRAKKRGQPPQGTSNVPHLLHEQPDETEPEHFDELVLCVQADDAKKLLGKHATWKEKFILGGVRFYNDITVTHSDSKYFQSVFENRFQKALCADATTPNRKDQISFATSEPQCRKDGWLGFQPMYFVHSFPSDPDKIEMGFDCTNYQHQFRSNIGEGNPPQEQDRHVFQTIFLNDQEKYLWTIDQIKEDKIIAKKWWHQWGHRWSHYLRVVPLMMFINGKNHTFFGGSWTLVVSDVFVRIFPRLIIFRTCMKLHVSLVLPLLIVWEPLTTLMGSASLQKISSPSIFFLPMASDTSPTSSSRAEHEHHFWPYP